MVESKSISQETQDQLAAILHPLPDSTTWIDLAVAVNTGLGTQIATRPIAPELESLKQFASNLTGKERYGINLLMNTLYLSLNDDKKPHTLGDFRDPNFEFPNVYQNNLFARIVIEVLRHQSE